MPLKDQEAWIRLLKAESVRKTQTEEDLQVIIQQRKILGEEMEALAAYEKDQRRAAKKRKIHE